MKRILLLMVLCCTSSSFLHAQTSANTQGTIVRMRMTECMPEDHGFMAAMSGGARVETSGECPEYVVLADKVVYVITGKSSDQLLPLAESTRFRFQKNEMLIRVDDTAKESHFRIRAMVLRAEWERQHAATEQDSQLASANGRGSEITVAGKR